jgi:hypothetical protein
MNVEIGAEAALFPDKEYIYGIFVAAQELIKEGNKWGTTSWMGGIKKKPNRYSISGKGG